MAPSAGERPALFRGCEQRPQAGETVGGGDTVGDELRQSFLDLRAQESASFDDLVVERRTVGAQMIDHRLRARADGGRASGSHRCHAMPCGGGPTRQKRDRCRADRPGMARGRTISISRWRQARPDRAAGQAQVVEPSHVVGIKTRRQELGFPSRNRCLEALQLADDGIERVRSLAPIVRHQVLPAEQEAHEILRADGLDFLTKALHRVAVVRASSDRTIPALERGREGSRHCNALRRQHDERRVGVGHGDAHRSGNGCTLVTGPRASRRSA